MTRQDKTHKTRKDTQGKTRQDKTRQDKIRLQPRMNPKKRLNFVIKFFLRVLRFYRLKSDFLLDLQQEKSRKVVVCEWNLKMGVYYTSTNGQQSGENI